MGKVAASFVAGSLLMAAAALSQAIARGVYLPQAPETDWSLYLPPGEGKELLRSLCTSCHGLDAILVQRRDIEAWQQTVKGMLADQDPRYFEYLVDEPKVLIRYLADYLGPLSPSAEALQRDSQLREKYLKGEMRSLININTASAEELGKVPGIGPAAADAIVRYRKDHGRFSSVDDLRKVKEVDPSQLDKVRPLLLAE